MFGADLLLALVLFTTALAVATQLGELGPRAPEQRALLEARRAVGALVLQPGEPLDWNASTVRVPGLARFPLAVEEERLARFLGLGAEGAADALGVSEYHFYFEALWLNGSTAQANGTNATLGSRPGADKRTIAIGESLARYRNQPLRVHVLLALPKSGCIAWSTGSAQWSSNVLLGVRVTNACGRTVTVTGARLTWSPTDSKLISKVIGGGVDRWSGGCDWGCTPTGSQPSGTLLDYGTRDQTLASGEQASFQADWGQDMAGTAVTIELIMSDGSVSSVSVNP